MKLSELHGKLIAIARTPTPNDAVPYAFEKRVMAHIRSLPVINPWSLWGKLLWKAAASFAAITMLCGVWSIGSSRHLESDNLSADLETAVYASVNQHVEDSW